MITQKMAASKDIAATWGGGRAEGAGRPSGPVRNGPDRSGPPLPCRGLDPCSSPVFCRQVESLQAACRHQTRCRTHVSPSLLMAAYEALHVKGQGRHGNMSLLDGLQIEPLERGPRQPPGPLDPVPQTETCRPIDLSAFKCPRVPGARSGGRSPAPKLIFQFF